jgi:transposase
MRRVIGMDLHRTFAEVVFWEDGRLRWYGRVDMTRAGLEGFGRSLTKDDEVVLEATGNAMAVVRVLRPYVARVIIANPLQVKAIAHAHVKTDKIDAGVLASLHAAGFLPEVWLPDAETERLRRLVARRNQIVRQRTRVKNETHAILAAHLVPPCPHAELFNSPGRAWLARQSCRTTSAPRSNGTCASSTGSAKIWELRTATSAWPWWTSRRCGVCSRSPA